MLYDLCHAILFNNLEKEWEEKKTLKGECSITRLFFLKERKMIQISLNVLRFVLTSE